MAHSPEGRSSSPDDDKSDTKKPKKDKAEASTSGSTRTVRFRLDTLDGKAARQHHGLPQTERSLLTGAALGGLKSEKDASAKPKPEAEDEAAAADRSKDDERPEHTEAGAAPETAQGSSGPSERTVAEREKDEHDRAEDSVEEVEDLPSWAAGPGPEIVVPLGKKGISGDIYDARVESASERPTDETETDKPSDEAIADRIAPPPEMTAAETEAATLPASGWYELPMQQHQAHDHETPPVAGSGGNETPPPPPHLPEGAGFGQPANPDQPVIIPAAEDFSRPEPAEVFREYARRDAESALQADAVSPAEPLVTRKQAAEQAYRAERTGQNRGLVTGLLVGGAYEHLKHKRREKRTTKTHQTEVRKLQNAQEAQTWAVKEQTQKQAETTRQLQSTEARLAAAEKRPQFQPLPPAEAARLAERQAKEQLRMQRVPEMPPLPIAEQPAEQIAIPPEHRIESSAWHHIEVDARTGRPVETPAFTYGREYYRERAHEVTPLAQRNAAAGEVALVAAAGGAKRTNDTGGGGGTPSVGSSTALPPASIPSATRQGPPSNADQAPPQPFSAPAPTGRGTAGPLWPYLVTLVAILICLVFLLH